MLHSISQQIWKTQQWPPDWKRSGFIPVPKKGNAKKCSNYCIIALISHTSNITLKILVYEPRTSKCSKTDLEKKRENGRNLFINMKFHSGADSGPKTSTFEKKAVESLEKRKVTWKIYIKKVFPPWGNFRLQPLIPHCCCSVTKLCPILCNPMDCSMPGSSVLHFLPEFAQIQVHWVGDAI